MQVSSLFERFTISHVILTSLVLHIFVIAQPQHLQIWDETIFLELVRNFLHGEDHTPYQLPGLNFFQGATIAIFGDNWFAWRIPSIIFGMLTLFVFYRILCHVTSERNALLATAILSFDTIFFVHSTLFLRDVPLIFFGMLSILFYFRKNYFLCAIPLGFAFLIKETALLFFIFLVIFHISTKKPWKYNIHQVKTGFLFIGIVFGSFIIPLWIYDVVFQPIVYEPVIPLSETADGKYIPIHYPKLKLMESRGYVYQEAVGKINNPVEHIQLMLSQGYILSEGYNVKNWDTRHTNFPWSWILPLPLPTDANGLGWVKEKIVDDTQRGQFNQGKIFAIEWRGDPNQSLWIIGFWGSIGFLGYSVMKNRNKTGLFVGTGIVSMYLPFLITSISGRVMFPYYFILTIPFISIGIVLLLDLVRNSKLRMFSKGVLLAGVITWFLWFYPLKII
ncbi:MAG: glycosyltransferase family 39 protein [Nitrosopumilaceae archaeon]|nr:glycosyltransferase family 39 protein [Nitrosopumilaceae archaeon]